MKISVCLIRSYLTKHTYMNNIAIRKCQFQQIRVLFLAPEEDQKREKTFVTELDRSELPTPSSKFEIDMFLSLNTNFT